MKKVSVIVPHYDQPEALKKCLHSICAQTYPGKIEVIVADNDSPQDLECTIAAYPQVIFLTVRERGAACARNAALEKASGEIIAFTDSDCVPATDWLETGIRQLEVTGTDIIGGSVAVTAEDEQSLKPVEAFEKVFAFRQELYVRKKHFSVTANIITWRRVVQKTGLFTNGLSEDVDWCHRAIALGFRLSFYSKCIVSHPARKDWSALTQKWSRLIAERWQGHKKNQSPLALFTWCVMAMATALSAIPHSFLVVKSPAIDSVQSKLAALRVLFAIRFWRCVNMIRITFADGHAVGDLDHKSTGQNDHVVQEV